MTSPRPTARALLFDGAPHGGTATALAGTGLVRTALRGARRLTGPALGTVNDEVGAIGDELLELDLGDALVLGWRKYAALTDAARRTLARPTSEEVVLLASHTVTSRYEPAIDVVVAGEKLTSFEFELVLAFELTGVAAVVRGGALTALRTGRCEVTGTLDLEGARLAAPPPRVVDLHLLLPLARPVLLVDVPAAGLPSQHVPTDVPSTDPASAV